MERLKHPRSKRQDDVVTWKQEIFTALYEDLKASKLPRGAVFRALNVLLFGSEARVRPGSKQWSATAFPTIPNVSFSSVSKSGDVITSSSETFAVSDVGKFFVWPDGEADLIISITDPNNVQVDNSTVNAQTTGVIRGKVNGMRWHRKSAKIFLHIDTRLFYADVLVGSWTQVYTFANQDLADSRTRIDFQDETVFLFNANGVYKVRATDTPVEVFKVNMPEPPNTIGLKSETNYPPTAEETFSNRFGRRYIFALGRLAGTGIRNRGTAEIIKESGPNTYPESNDFKDYKESWRTHYFGGVSNASYTVLRQTLNINSTHVLHTWNSNSNFGMRPTIGGITRDVKVDLTGAEDWDGIASAIQESIRNYYPEYKFATVFFDSGGNGTLVFLSGDPDVSFTAIASPNDASLADFTGSGYLDSLGSVAIEGHHVIGDTSSQALQIPAGQEGWTHFPVYSTLTLGPDSRDAQGNSLVNKEYFIWNADVRVVGSFMAFIRTNAVFIASGSFENMDNGSVLHVEDATSSEIKKVQLTGNGTSWSNLGTIGDKYKSTGTNDSTNANHLIDSTATFASDGVAVGDHVMNFSDDTFSIVTNVTETDLTLEDDIFPVAGGTGRTYMAGARVMAIGSSTLRSGTKTGTTITKESGPDFTSNDIGKLQYWDDGSYSLITGIQSTTVANVAENSTDSTLRAFASDPIGRNYDDNQTDDQLEARAKSFPLLNRFWTALPSGELGAAAPGFLVTAPLDSTKFYYSQFSEDFAYLVGHYYPEFQYKIVNDLIKSIRHVGDMLVAMCKGSTWGSPTNAVQTVDDARAGESISVLASLKSIDPNVGAVNDAGITEYGKGFLAVITSEPGIRIFNGFEYGPDLTMDRDGGSHIRDALQKMRPEFFAYYEPNLYGLMIWSNTASWDMGISSIVKPNKCYRLSLDKKQGFSFAELSGSDWLYPELHGALLKVEDSKGDPYTLVFDSNDGRPYLLSTRKAPDASSQPMSFVDKENDKDTEITWLLTRREHTAPDEENDIEFMADHLYLRPHDEANKNASGYDAYGFRSAQKITVKAYLNGNTSESSEVTTEDPKAVMYHPYNLQNRRVQLEVSGTASEISVTGIKSIYNVLKRRVPPTSETEERIWQRQLQEELKIWLSRNDRMDLNLANGASPVTVGAHTLYTGPDGIVGSAMKISSPYFYDIDFGDRDRGYIFGIHLDGSLTADVIKEIRSGSPDHELRFHVSGTTLNFDWKGVNYLTSSLSLDTWYLFYVYRRYLAGKLHVVRWSSSGVEVQEASFGIVHGISNTQIKVGDSDSNLLLFDVRCFWKANLPQEGFTYYKRDVFDRAGFSLLPAKKTDEFLPVP